MLETSFEQLYLRFRANYYKRMVEKIGPREGSLSATESYCVEIIYLLDKPTISEFAKFLNISVPNANYKVNGLVEKNYVVRVPSTRDKREYHLVVTEKFLDYYGLKDKGIAHLIKRMRQRFTAEEIEQFDKAICIMVELMEEDVDAKNPD